MPLLLLKLLPSAWSRWAVALAAVAALCLLSAFKGCSYERARWERQQAADERVFLEGVQRAARIGDRVTVQYVDKVRVVHERGEVIYRTVPQYITAAADAACTVPLGFVRVHDAAAQAVLPPAPASTDADAADVALSDVARTVTLNYEDFHAMRAQCEGLQQWAREVTDGRLQSTDDAAQAGVP